MRPSTATAAAVAAGLAYAAEVAGGGFFGPVDSTRLGRARWRTVRNLSEEPPSRWFGARRDTRFYKIRGGASGKTSVLVNYR